MGFEYQPDADTDPKTWLDLTDDERIDACERAHRLTAPWHPPVSNSRLHAVLHSVVENQLATHDPPEAKAALERLVHQGMSRHQAIHALAEVAADEMQRVVTQKVSFDRQGYARRLGGLTRSLVERGPASERN
jgi:hypothetical protein